MLRKTTQITILHTPIDRSYSDRSDLYKVDCIATIAQWRTGNPEKLQIVSLTCSYPIAQAIVGKI